jgi:hypothetical protein
VLIVDAGWPLDGVLIAVTVNAKSTSLSDGGVISNPVNSPGVRVQLPSPLSMPADRVAPAGTPEITMDKISPALGFTSAASMLSAMTPSSVPVASSTLSVGFLAIALAPVWVQRFSIIVVTENPLSSTNSFKINAQTG